MKKAADTGKTAAAKEKAKGGKGAAAGAAGAAKQA